jgi:hypothetical protein
MYEGFSTYVFVDRFFLPCAIQSLNNTIQSLNHTIQSLNHTPHPLVMVYRSYLYTHTHKQSLSLVLELGFRFKGLVMPT